MMKIKVKVYVNNIPVDSKELRNYQIKSSTIDRIVNAVRKREAAPQVCNDHFRKAEGQ